MSKIVYIAFVGDLNEDFYFSNPSIIGVFSSYKEALEKCSDTLKQVLYSSNKDEDSINKELYTLRLYGINAHARIMAIELDKLYDYNVLVF